MSDRQSGSIAAASAASQAETKEESFNLSKSTAFALLQGALRVLKEVVGKTQVPGLQEGMKALVVILDVIQVRPCSNMRIFV